MIEQRLIRDDVRYQDLSLRFRSELLARVRESLAQQFWEHREECPNNNEGCRSESFEQYLEDYLATEIESLLRRLADKKYSMVREFVDRHCDVTLTRRTIEERGAKLHKYTLVDLGEGVAS